MDCTSLYFFISKCSFVMCIYAQRYINIYTFWNGHKIFLTKLLKKMIYNLVSFKLHFEFFQKSTFPTEACYAISLKPHSRVKSRKSRSREKKSWRLPKHFHSRRVIVRKHEKLQVSSIGNPSSGRSAGVCSKAF